MTTQLPWRGHLPTIAGAGAGITLDVIDGAPVAEGDVGSFHYVSQARPPVQIDLWIGPEVSLAWWRARFGSRALMLGLEAASEVDGRPRTCQEVVVAAQRAGSAPMDDGTIGPAHRDRPPEVHVAIAGETASGAAFVVAWRVLASERAALAADEAYFLSSIRCR